MHYGLHRPLREGLLRPEIGHFANPERSLARMSENQKRNRHLANFPKLLIPVLKLVEDMEKNGAADRTRTYYPIITNDVLYLMSYSGILLFLRPFYGPTSYCAPSLTHWRQTSIVDGPATYE